MFSVSIAAARLGVCTKTIRRWDKQGLIECYRTLGNHRRIPLREIARIKHGTAQEKLLPAHPAVYARVSSHRQKAAGDLARKVEELCQHSRKFPKNQGSWSGFYCTSRRIYGLDIMIERCKVDD
ncbi:MAG: MerR family DNA-binding transcriptional regulator [Candidatus Lokiarchaeota archaeon]|nr:MerR family DNA-binding transcriptional regulator [Candidatus Lokiarchaeota archaeon]